MSRTYRPIAVQPAILQIQLPAHQRKQPRQARSVAMVEALKRAASDILEADGREALSLHRLSEYAGVAFSSIYEYFPTLESLVSAIFDDFRDCQHRVLLERIAVLPSSSTLYDGLLLMLDSFLSIRRKQMQIDPCFNVKYVHYSELQRLELVKADMPASQATQALMERYARELRLENPQKAIFLVYHTLSALTRTMALERPEYLEEGSTAEMIARMLHALLVDPSASSRAD
jgi:AcrR family transcriptional regulator